jgi:hydrogenase maturation protein HypF
MTSLTNKSVSTARLEARRWLLRGRVQGIGFRPFVYRLATEIGLAGWVRNTSGGAEVWLEGSNDQLNIMDRRLRAELPPPGRIDECRCEMQRPKHCLGVTIESSEVMGPRGLRVPADRAVCAECHRDVLNPTDRRYRYPFTACTQCGPRYSIIESLPYDRAGTSLNRFPLCDACASEYRSPTNRRFHAQAIVCANCGPRLTLRSTQGIIECSELALSQARAALRQGQCLALKGLGGYQLLVRADDDDAVARLRERKRRPTKPFAVMVDSWRSAEGLAVISAEERHWLLSPENPIVLLKQRRNAPISQLVAPHLSLLGLFLPTTPLHSLLLQDLGFPVIATSGNRSDEPPAIDSATAHQHLTNIADAFLEHDRSIVRRLDDSVVRVMNGAPVVFRLGRGFAPSALPNLERFSGPPLLAVGGHLKSAIAAWTGQQALLLQHGSDLDDPDGRAGFETLIRDVQRLYDFRPELLVIDHHPDYFPSRWAESQSLPIVRVQHHHAHAAAVQAEHGLLDQRVVALTWDGTGYGLDAAMWGGETLVVEPDGQFQRVATLRPIPLIGGDAAIREPARIAVALCWDALGGGTSFQKMLRRLGIDAHQADVWIKLLQANVHTVKTTAVGRLLDGLAMLILGNLAISYEAEAVIRLEDIVDDHEAGTYSMPLTESAGVGHGDWRPLVRDLVADLERQKSTGSMAGKVHATLVRWGAATARLFPNLPVVLGGGCFQNRWLTEPMKLILDQPCYSPSMIPPGDGGLAAGQLAVALQQRQARVC